MLWLGVHLPVLSLSSLAAELGPAAAAEPLALIGQHRLLAVNAAAQALGLAPGMKRATALALCPTLRLGAADAARDARALRDAAHRLMVYTPSVVECPPQALLAELQPSLRCFGGLAALRQQLLDALAPLAQPLQLAWAPSAQGAAWLARWTPDDAAPATLTRAVLAPPPPPGGAHSRDPAWAALQHRLDALPAQVLADTPAQAEALQAMGLVTLADWRRQPRAGLARRFGPAPLEALDRAWGTCPDPREPLQPPDRFAEHLELPGRTDDVERLLEGALLLLGRLAAWVRALQARVGRFTLVFHHETRLRAGPAGEAGAHTSPFTLALAQPSAEAAHWQVLLRERLAREPLAAPVLGLTLRCDEPVRSPGPPTMLFDEPGASGEGLVRLLERLQARLGEHSVGRLAPRPEHRPEQASTTEPLPAWERTRATLPLPAVRLTRPAWLLPQPLPLPEQQARPWLDGQPLRLLAGPERIEAGWWDGRPVARDYFIAQTPQQALLWVYRLRPAPPAGQPGWFLHGRFA